MIDVHMLQHTKSPYTVPLIHQLAKERDITLHTIINDDNIGNGRALGYLKGNHPYVSYVDYDDLIEPGIFTKINTVMETGIPWCYTDEELIDEKGISIGPGWSSHPGFFNPSVLDFVQVGPDEYANHIIAFRRELLTPKVIFIMKQLKELSDPYLLTELSKYPRIHIKEVGYYWRQHKDNATKSLECVQFMSSQLKERRDGINTTSGEQG